MDALITNKILSTGNEMYVDTVPYFKINNELVKLRPMLSKKKGDSSVCQIRHNHTVVFFSVRRFCLINESVIGIGNVTDENIFDAIGKPCLNNPTLKNRSSLINKFIYKVRKISVSKTVIAFPATNIIKQCVHIPIKHSEIDFVVLQPNPFEHHL